MDAISVVRLALKVLTDRLIMLVLIILAFILALYVMYFGDWQRVVCLAIFMLFGYLLARFTQTGASNERHQRPGTEE